MHKHSFAALLAIVIMAFAPTLGLAQNPGRSAWAKGEQQRRAGNNKEAINYYKEAISLEDNNYRYYASMGMAYVKLNQIPQAIQAFESSVRVNPGFGPGYVYLSRLALKQKDYQAAVRYVNQAYDNEQDQSKKLQYKLLAVKLLLKIDQPQQAMAELNKAKSLAPNDPRVMGTEGDVQLKLGNYAAAEAAYQSALNRLGDKVPANQKLTYHIGLATSRYKKGNTEEADKYANEFIRPVSGRGYKLYQYQTRGQGAARFLATARGYLSANAFNEAMTYVNKAIEAGDRNDISYKMQGLLYYKQGQMQQAISAFQKSAQAISDEKARAKTYKTMVKLQFNAQMYREAVQTANGYLSQDPGNPSVLLYKAQSLYLLGQYQAAIEAAQTGIAKVPNKAQQAVYQFVIGLSAKKAGNTELAASAFEASQAASSFRLAARQEIRDLGVN